MPRIFVDGDPIEAAPGDTLAAALLRAGVITFTRSIKYHRPRGPFCFAGSCGQCLMRVDGVPSLPSCRVQAQEGMVCERQNGPLGVENDFFRAADFLFPEGLDHHHLMTRSRLLGRVALEIARRLAGLGELPDTVRARVRGELRAVKLAIVGAGPAGLAAAGAASSGTLLLEREPRVGGAERLFNTSTAPDAGPAEVLLDAECVGLYANDTAVPGNALLAVRHGDRLLAIAAGRVIVATGGVSQPLPFPGVDRPGVYAARGLLGLPAIAGRKLAVVGEGAELQRCAEALSRRGYEIALVQGVPRRALGNPVKALDTADGTRIRCDAVAIALPPAPLHELATSAGAQARFDGAGFPVGTDGEGRTSIPWLFAAGTAAGKPALASGEAAGSAACR
jgi:sarcosine oxidase subunit alpha